MGSTGALGNFVGGVFNTAADIYKAKEAARAAERIAELNRQETTQQMMFAAEQRKDLLVAGGLFLVFGFAAYKLVTKAL